MKRELAVLSCLLLAGCGTAGTYGSTPGVQSTGTSIPAATSSSSPAAFPAVSCHARHVVVEDPQAWEPDPRCTPGTTDGGLTAAQLCPRADTQRIRPPVSYTEPLKKASMKTYGFAGSPALFEMDHDIPLSLGGSPRNPLNMWSEPHASINEKDKTEFAAHDAVCSGKLGLVDAQHRISTDWYSLGKDLGVVR